MFKGFTKGFTLIELVIVIVILGILAAIVIPKYENLEQSAKDAAAKGSESAVKSAFAIALAKKQGPPTVTQISDAIGSGDASAIGSGIQVIISGSTYVVPTLKGTDCDTATNDVSDPVCAIGNIVAAS